MTVSVCDYGASPTAPAEANTASFQAALDTGSRVKVPPGTYQVGALRITNEASLIGDGWRSVLRFGGEGPALTVSGWGGGSVERLKLVGDGKAGVHLGGFAGVGNVGYTRLHNLHLSGFDVAVATEKAYNVELANLATSGCRIAIAVGPGTISAEIRNCFLRGWSECGIDMSGTVASGIYGVTVRKCIVDEAATGALCAVRLSRAHSCLVTECHIEGVPTGVVVENGSIMSAVTYNWCSYRVDHPIDVRFANTTLVMGNRYLVGSNLDAGVRTEWVFDSPYHSLGSGGYGGSRVALGTQRDQDGWLCVTSGNGVKTVGE